MEALEAELDLVVCITEEIPQHDMVKIKAALNKHKKHASLENVKLELCLGTFINLEGIGEDPFNGTNFVDCVERFLADPQTEGIVLIGEIGGTAEEDAAALIEKFERESELRPPIGDPDPSTLVTGDLGGGVEIADWRPRPRIDWGLRLGGPRSIRGPSRQSATTTTPSRSPGSLVDSGSPIYPNSKPQWGFCLFFQKNSLFWFLLWLAYHKWEKFLPSV
ncbi:hypothetical protein CRG98_007895 [Punica granatum]|uniref:ATP-citrate synthase/succinyl-CoA ligase C-terminal domain-containing protein n=1 Tax=Punica granatum TaxID=22663 RepID=A0A2I0KTG1_PUNGR|nr:hypothetical protein CRG98_007895 [Punica granatum]